MELHELVHTLRFGAPEPAPSLFDEGWYDEPEKEPELDDVFGDFDDIPGACQLLEDEFERHAFRSRLAEKWEHASRTPHWSLTKRIDKAKKRAPGDFNVRRWRRIVAAFESCCAYCGKKGTERTLVMEHVIPISLGGCTDENNILPSCWDCNRLKGARRLDQWIGELKWRPFIARYLAAAKRYGIDLERDSL